MRTIAPAPPCPAPRVATQLLTAARFRDYVELAKPRIAVMVLLTVVVGFTLGSAASWDGIRLLHALAGVLLVATSSSALNQFLERISDGMMRRTAQRPLPAGRLAAAEVLTFGIVTGVAGTIWLAALVNGLTAGLALGGLLLYTAVYTPLKRRTSFCTAIGALPGALPPVLGWTAAGGGLGMPALILFAILYLWQFPHFLAIAWMYREEYCDAGLRMLPAGQPAPRVTGLLAAGYALALLPVSLLPAFWALAGGGYTVVALALSGGYLAAALLFAWKESRRSARRLLFASLFYLPLLLLTLTCNHLQLLS